MGTSLLNYPGWYNEFPDEEPFQRFPLLDGSSQDRDPGRYINALSSYFETEPYSSWFGTFEPLLNGLGSSFYKKSNASARALHTDLCSPVATAPTWSGLDEANRKSLEADGIPLWHKLLEKLQPQVVLLSVAQHYLEHIRFEPLTDWEIIHTFTETANGAPLQQPYSISVRWYNVGGQMCMFAFGRAAQTPFGLLANTHKQEAGERLLERYQQGCPIVRRFIQFPHPGPEHEPDDPNGKVKSWSERHDLNGRALDHKRKFMRLRGGEWIDREGRKHKGDLDAWGEWEPESNLISGFNPEDDQLPKYLWELYWIRKKHHTDLHNTDPFIFGDCFLFSNCKQRKHGKKTALQNLAPGSLIIFGSRKGGRGYWTQCLLWEKRGFHTTRKIPVQRLGEKCQIRFCT